MSGLLKAQDRTAQAAVRRLSAVPLTRHEPTCERPSPKSERDVTRFDSVEQKVTARTEELDRQCITLEATIAGLRHQLQQAEEDSSQRTADALERGRSEGEALAETSEAERLQALANSLARLEREQTDRLADCEVLALQLANTALARILGKQEVYAELVSAALGHQLAQLKRGLALGVRVSRADFHDAKDLAALSQAHGIAVSHDDDLEGGECRLDLKLGQLDLGIPGQWRRLTAYLEDLASEERAK